MSLNLTSHLTEQKTITTIFSLQVLIFHNQFLTLSDPNIQLKQQGCARLLEKFDLCYFTIIGKVK